MCRCNSQNGYELCVNTLKNTTLHVCKQQQIASCTLHSNLLTVAHIEMKLGTHVYYINTKTLNNNK